MMCQARMWQGWHKYRCTKKRNKERQGLSLCGIHARVFDRWDNDPSRGEGSGLRMAKFYWNAEPVRVNNNMP